MQRIYLYPRSLTQESTWIKSLFMSQKERILGIHQVPHFSCANILQFVCQGVHVEAENFPCPTTRKLMNPRVILKCGVDARYLFTVFLNHPAMHRGSRSVGGKKGKFAVPRNSCRKKGWAAAAAMLADVMLFKCPSTFWGQEKTVTMRE